MYLNCRYGNRKEEAEAESYAGGVGAIIAEGWRGHVLCTWSLVSCVWPIFHNGNLFFPHISLCWSLSHVKQPFSTSFKLCVTTYHNPLPPTYTFTHLCTNKVLFLVTSKTVSKSVKDMSAGTRYIPKWVILSSILNLRCSYPLPHLPTPPSQLLPPVLPQSVIRLPSNGPPMGDRDQIIMDHGIQKLKDTGFFLQTQEVGTLNRKVWTSS